jgi:excisionase family DNA binding protein
MKRDTFPPDVANAFATIARFFLAELRAAAREPQQGDAGEYVDARSAATGRKTFLRAAKAGAFPSYRVGRRVLARKADVDAWIVSRKRAPRIREQADPHAEDRAILAKAGLCLKSDLR